MLKVNEDKLLLDYLELSEKAEKNLVEIENQATIYAVDRGYDEEKTAKFVAFTKELEGNGLSAEENTKLELLGSYIDEVEGLVEEPESGEPAEAEHTEEVGTSATAFSYGTINNI